MTDREILEMLAEGQQQIFVRLDGIDVRLDGIDARLDGIDARLNGIDEEMSSMKNRLATLAERQRLLEKKFDRMINFDFKQMKDTQDTIVTLLQIRGIIPEKSIQV